MMWSKSTNKPAKGGIGLWLVALICVVLAGWLFLSRQTIIDTVRYWQYTPSSSIKQLVKNTGMTDAAKFYFYASQPELIQSSSFNAKCERREADSPILGCYNAHQIVIYGVTNAKLNGIEEVTAAHELLHAVFERMSASEIAALTPEIRSAYERVKTPELAERMKYYQKNEPGEDINELHSILGTEFANLGSKLEAHYAKYFSNREKLVAYNQKVQKVFTSLQADAKSIANQIDTLADDINASIKSYNSQTTALSSEITAFNARAKQTDGFKTQAEFRAARAALMAKVSELNAQRSSIEAKIAKYNSLRSQLEAVAAESDALNRSIDSTLAPASSL